MAEAVTLWNHESPHSPEPSYPVGTTEHPLVVAVASGGGGSGGVGGDASAVNQIAANDLLDSIDGKTPPLGQALAGASTPVVLPAAQIATLTPPAAITGFSTSANQATEIASLASLDGKTPGLGQALAGASVPVVLTAAQVAALTPPAAITGFATAASQGTEITVVTSIDSKTPALGQALAAASVPVVLPAAQITALTPPAAITGFSSAANQALELAAIGAPADVPATTDIDTFSLIALFKRLLGKITTQFPAALTGNGNLKVAIQEVVPPTTFTTGQKAVTTAGARVPLVASSTPLARGMVRITALPSNTGIVYVGGATVSSSNGEALSSDKTLIMEIDNLNKIYLDTNTSGHAVSFLAY